MVDRTVTIVKMFCYKFLRQGLLKILFRVAGRMGCRRLTMFDVAVTARARSFEADVVVV